MKFLLVLAVAGGACVPPPPPATVVFGDSNVAFARVEALSLMGDGVVYNATYGFSIDDWATEMAAVEGGTVVVALGANDVLEGDEAVEVDLHNALIYLEDADCVVWLTLNEASFTGAEHDAAVAFNEQLRAKPGLEVFEWSTTEMQPADPVHYTTEGYDDYAHALADAEGLCDV